MAVFNSFFACLPEGRSAPTFGDFVSSIPGLQLKVSKRPLERKASSSPMRGATFILVNFKLHLQSEFPSDSIDKNGRIWNAKWMGKRDVIRCERDVTGIK